MQEVFVNWISRFLVASFMTAAILLPNMACAMEIRQFDKMADQDQADYIQVLVNGAQKVLKEEGRDALATKMDQLFTEIPAGDKISLGMEEFEDNLALARVADAQRALSDSNAKRLQVEVAMIVTLQNNGIILPTSFMHVGDNFQPKAAMVTHNPDGTMIFRKEPPNEEAKGTKAEKGLVIPAQVVVPFIPTSEKKQ